MIFEKVFEMVTKRQLLLDRISLQREMKKLSKPDTKDVFHLLLEQIEHYEPLRLVDFQLKMLNNDKGTTL